MSRLPLIAILFAISSAPLARSQRTSCVFTRDNYGNSIKVCKPSLPSLRSSHENQPPPNCPPPPPVYLNKYYMPTVPYNVPPGCPTYGYPQSPQYQAAPPANYPQYGYPDQQHYAPPQPYYPPSYGQPPPPQYPTVTANYLPQQPQQASPHLVKQKSSDQLRSLPLMSNMQYGEAANWRGVNPKSSSQLNTNDQSLQMAQAPLNSRSSGANPQMDTDLQAPASAPQLSKDSEAQQNLQEKVAELKECKDQLKSLSDENKQLKENLEEIARKMMPNLKQQTKRDSSTTHHSGKPPEAINAKRR